MSKNPIRIALVLLVIAELGARQLDPYWRVPHASETSVNAQVNRGWPSYIAPRDLEKPLVAIVSNSQAVARDLPDPERRYPAQLKAALRDLAVVENWSSPGIRTGELEILTAQAVRRDARLLVFVLGYFNFDRQPPSLYGGNSDIHTIVGEPGFWPHAETMSIAPTIRWADFSDRWIVSISGLAHSRQRVIDWTAGRIDPAHHRAIFGAKIPDRRPPQTRVSGARIRLLEPSPQARDFLDAEALASTDKRFSGFEALLPQLVSLRERVLFVLMPIRREARERKLLEKADRFNAGVAARLQREGIATLDWSDLVAGERFFSRSHVDELGHNQIAQALEPEIRHALRY